MKVVLVDVHDDDEGDDLGVVVFHRRSDADAFAKMLMDHDCSGAVREQVVVDHPLTWTEFVEGGPIS